MGVQNHNSVLKKKKLRLKYAFIIPLLKWKHTLFFKNHHINPDVSHKENVYVFISLHISIIYDSRLAQQIHF